MSFDRGLYIAEMAKMLEVAHERWQREHPGVAIFAVNVWTDPEARCSAVNIETRHHSDNHVKENHEFAVQARTRELERGNMRMADLFLRHLESQRNTNPADFEFREFSTAKHRSFDKAWAADPGCWDELEPQLIQVRDMAKTLFRDATFDADAEVSVNGRDSWYANPVSFDMRSSS